MEIHEKDFKKIIQSHEKWFKKMVENVLNAKI